MADSLRDQLLKSGLVQKLKSEAKPAAPAPRPQGRPATTGAPNKHGGKPQHPHKPQQTSPHKPKPAGGEPDLAQAYALRAREERSQREREQREAELRAKEKRERKEKLAKLLDGKALNAADAEHARHFPHGAKIRRVYCTSEQLAALNRGELAVVQQNGRYLLVTAQIAREAEGLSADALVLLVDPNAPAEDDVPADLIW
ncbi:MAG TPA: DUF2058 family protein [Tahibacter sp.]|nr:DUF2058 family protein [Tahibacter sp.]